VEDLLRGLGERDHDVLMVCGRGGQAAAEQGRRVITSAAVAGADLFSDRPLDQSALRALIADVRREFDPDVIHVHNPNHFHPVLADAVLDNGGSCRRVASVHDRGRPSPRTTRR
jgi:hypothetical protein